MLRTIAAIILFTQVGLAGDFSGSFPFGRGFVVDHGSSPNDLGWGHVTGGNLSIEIVDTSIGSDQTTRATLTDAIMKGFFYTHEKERVDIEIGPCANNYQEACLTLRGKNIPPKVKKHFIHAIHMGERMRKNITVTLTQEGTNASRSLNLLDCFPVQWSSVNFDTSSSVQTETLTVKIGRIEFKT